MNFTKRAREFSFGKQDATDYSKTNCEVSKNVHAGNTRNTLKRFSGEQISEHTKCLIFIFENTDIYDDATIFFTFSRCLSFSVSTQKIKIKDFRKFS